MKKRFSALLIAAVTICLAAGTALAANYLLTAGEAAAELSGSTVARAFEGEGALAVNEARTAGSCLLYTSFHLHFPTPCCFTYPSVL